ncbi:hypothetical protein T484DRAFT_3503891 [Baffinella frigidus]|nr:hypothetical protein T484DRAFT_3503891 [Cryptophyta sp. CCMP2293]
MPTHPGRISKEDIFAAGAINPTPAKPAKADHVPTDCLSDGYASDDESSLRVVALLKSGVRARQADQIAAAKSDYAKARAMQTNRGKKKSKLAVWLEGVARKHGKERVREAAREIQRVYQGMLGRVDARYERMVLRKKRAAVRKEAGTRTLQRLWRGHWARLRSKWRMRLRREEVASASTIQAHLRATLIAKLLRRSAAARMVASAWIVHTARALLGRRRSAQERRLRGVRCDAARKMQGAWRDALERRAKHRVEQCTAARLLQGRARRLRDSAAAAARVQAWLADDAAEAARLAEEQRLEAEHAAAEARRRAGGVVLAAWRCKAARAAVIFELARSVDPATGEKSLASTAHLRRQRCTAAQLHMRLRAFAGTRERAAAARVIQSSLFRPALARSAVAARRREAAGRRRGEAARGVQRWWLAVRSRRAAARGAARAKAVREVAAAGAMQRAWRACYARDSRREVDLWRAGLEEVARHAGARVLQGVARRGRDAGRAGVGVGVWRAEERAALLLSEACARAVSAALVRSEVARRQAARDKHAAASLQLAWRGCAARRRRRARLEEERREEEETARFEASRFAALGRAEAARLEALVRAEAARHEHAGEALRAAVLRAVAREGYCMGRGAAGVQAAVRRALVQEGDRRRAAGGVLGRAAGVMLRRREYQQALAAAQHQQQALAAAARVCAAARRAVASRRLARLHSAATRIQAVVRGRFGRVDASSRRRARADRQRQEAQARAQGLAEARAALRIQARARGFLARLRVARLRAGRALCAAARRAAWRRGYAREVHAAHERKAALLLHGAVATLQCTARAFLAAGALGRLRRTRVEGLSAETLQRAGRGCVARRRLREALRVREERAAAVRVQSWLRAAVGRRVVQALLVPVRREKAAGRIGAAWRGVQGRREAWGVRETQRREGAALRIQVRLRMAGMCVWLPRQSAGGCYFF